MISYDLLEALIFLPWYACFLQLPFLFDSFSLVLFSLIFFGVEISKEIKIKRIPLKGDINSLLNSFMYIFRNILLFIYYI